MVSDHFGEVRFPIPVPPEQWRIDAAGCEFLLNGLLQSLVLLIDRRFSAEHVVVLAHLFKALVRNPSSPGNVLQERQDIFGLFRPAKGHQHNCIKRRYLHVSHRDPPRFLLGQLPPWAKSPGASSRKQLPRLAFI
ncbi:hypothetical protein D3C74_197160 [compost metagenome]